MPGHHFSAAVALGQPALFPLHIPQVLKSPLIHPFWFQDLLGGRPLLRIVRHHRSEQSNQSSLLLFADPLHSAISSWFLNRILESFFPWPSQLTIPSFSLLVKPFATALPPTPPVGRQLPKRINVLLNHPIVIGKECLEEWALAKNGKDSACESPYISREWDGLLWQKVKLRRSQQGRCVGMVSLCNGRHERLAKIGQKDPSFRNGDLLAIYPKPNGHNAVRRHTVTQWLFVKAFDRLRIWPAILFIQLIDSKVIYALWKA